MMTRRAVDEGLINHSPVACKTEWRGGGKGLNGLIQERNRFVANRTITLLSLLQLLLKA
jgi:hypothetical protein